MLVFIMFVKDMVQYLATVEDICISVFVLYSTYLHFILIKMKFLIVVFEEI